MTYESATNDAARDAADLALSELEQARVKFPTWPIDPLHALAVLNEEVGELQKAVLQSVYEPAKNPPHAVRTEAIQAAAMTLRFLAGILSGHYAARPGMQATDD